MSPIEVLSAIRAAEVESPPGFDDLPLGVEGGMTFDLPADVVVRPQTARSALVADDAAIQAYSYSGATVFQGTRLVREAAPSFVLFVYGHVAGRQRLIEGALRIYSDSEDELSRLARDPSLCFAAVLERYGLDYAVGEGQRRRFVPVRLIPRAQLNLTPPILAERLMPEIWKALDLRVPSEQVIANVQLKIPSDGPVQLLWPFALTMDRYVSDVRRKR